MNGLKFTLKAWPVVTLLTIGLCYLTQVIAKHVFGIDLPDQENIEIVKRMLGLNWNFAFLCLQILLIMPALEELLFRGLAFKLPLWLLERKRQAPSARIVWSIALLSAMLFSAAHYLFQPWPDAAFFALFFFGIAQCWLYRKTKHLWCTITNHALFNLTNLALLFVL